ncbi:MAG TPA: phytanoyl-CoA dioxygenase family protein [Pirellulales bacterium]|jgi:phytanoyl-CoA hydroxylase|nr:phytanoyl-CoA dioxygenase family protein [Pirellulales bacterium]
MSLTALGADEIARRLFRYTECHTPLPGVESVGPEHLDQFRRDGFLAVENVFSPAEVEEAKQALSFLIAGGNPAYRDVFLEDVAEGAEIAPHEREPYVRKLHYFVDFEPRLARLAAQPALVGLVERIVGTETRMIQDMALLKPAHVGREKPWHQDTAYFVMEPIDLVLGTWIALDAATAENGCMHVIPGSHGGGPRPHYHDRDCQLPDETVEVDRDLMVPLAPGGALLFSGLLHHATPPNRSPSRRRALQFHYASVNCRKIDADRHAQYFFDGRGYAACAVAHTGLAYRPIAEQG